MRTVDMRARRGNHLVCGNAFNQGRHRKLRATGALLERFSANERSTLRYSEQE